jgi:hypothetical protein
MLAPISIALLVLGNFEKMDLIDNVSALVLLFILLLYSSTWLPKSVLELSGNAARDKYGPYSLNSHRLNRLPRSVVILQGGIVLHIDPHLYMYISWLPVKTAMLT